jgi:hypothetical protein
MKVKANQHPSHMYKLTKNNMSETLKSAKMSSLKDKITAKKEEVKEVKKVKKAKKK